VKFDDGEHEYDPDDESQVKFDDEEHEYDPADESKVEFDDVEQEDKVYSTFLSQKGKVKITIEGFCFQKNRNYLQDTSYWRCEDHNLLRCRATLKAKKCEGGYSVLTMNSKFQTFVLKLKCLNTFFSGKHNHLPDARRVVVGEVLADVRDDAKRNTGSKPSRILRDIKAKRMRSNEK
jgi:FLYWCH zinc finger domain